MKKTYIAILLSLTIATPALADNTSKAYIAADFGSATYSNVAEYPTSTNIIRIAGGYYINSSVAVEVGYTKFADVALVNATSAGRLSASTFQVAAVGIYPLNNQFDITGKLGISMNTVKDSGTLVNGSNPWSYPYSKTSLMYGVGAQYHMTRQFSVRAQYEYFGDMSGTSPAVTSSAISVGVAYIF